MSKYDYLIVGAGIYGATFAERAMSKGKSVLVIDRRSHIAGNCYTEKIKDIHVHKYGCHIFNTNKGYVWYYLNNFTKFNNYRHTGKVNYHNKIYSFPINLMTLHQIWGIRTPEEAEAKLNEVRVKIKNPGNMEEWCLSQIGEELYEIFVKHYSTKQWGRHPSQLPASIIRRIPVRLTYNEDYYENATYQGIPVNGYTEMISNMLDGASVELGVDFDKSKWKEYAKHLVYCGPIDKFFDCEYGELEYRSLRWETKILDGDYQGCSVINHTDLREEFTRTIEHKHFDLKGQKKTVVSWEYPMDWTENKEPYYPIVDNVNRRGYEKYKALADQQKDVLISGRLGKFQYLDMDDCVAMAIKEAEERC